jgi:glutathione S-transferase
MPVLRHVIRLNMAVTPERVAQAKKSLPSYFDKIVREVGPSGYLVGDAFSVADLTAAAMLSLIVRPEQFPYALPDEAPPGLVELCDQLANHEGFAWVREIYAKHRPPEQSVLNA